jgi:hypothetical protein
MKKYIQNIIVCACIVIITPLLNSCAPTTVYSDYTRTTDFKSYKSFAWLPKNHDPQQNATFDNAIVETNIKNLASGELKNRGYQVNTAEPDILVDFHIAVADKVQQVSTPIYGHPYNYNNYNNYYNTNNPNRAYNNSMYSYNNSYNNNGYYNNAATTIVGYNTQNIPYEEGTLTIIMIDRKSNQLIWKGWSVGTVTDEQTFEYELSSDIRRLFKEFPVPIPKAKK